MPNKKTDNLVVCKDCKYFSHYANGMEEDHVCRNPLCITGTQSGFSFVSGRWEHIMYPTCATARSCRGKCRGVGKYFKKANWLLKLVKGLL
jgi:hypothetical protein